MATVDTGLQLGDPESASADERRHGPPGHRPSRLLRVSHDIYWRIHHVLVTVPLVHAAYVPHDESKPHAHALTSTILFNGNTVSKIYAPGLVPRAIYWLAFQAPFPYMRNEAALRAAILRRNLAGMLTEYWYGSNRVARAIAIDQIDGRSAITSEYVPGGPPTDRHAAHAFLDDLARRFDAVGLPTWQVDPRQPRAMDNLLETPDGVYHIIDLESGLVSPLASPRAWWRAFQRGLVPIYDDVYFDLTRAYVDREAPSIREAKGDHWLEELRRLLDEAEAETRAWHAGEPRIWSRFVQRVIGLLHRPGRTATRSLPTTDETNGGTP
ncbi:MAG TPA: hypothetical protein VFV93_17995 [Thermomicrobiales bacterium]|nr:hypothetical protein [Thermomicrobiales bacterium]